MKMAKSATPTTLATTPTTETVTATTVVVGELCWSEEEGEEYETADRTDLFLSGIRTQEITM